MYKVLKTELIVTTRTDEMVVTLGSSRAIDCDMALDIVNANRAPNEQAHALPNYTLNGREAQMINRLIDICTGYQEKGEEELSQIVDRIGLTLMQAFIKRSAAGM